MDCLEKLDFDRLPDQKAFDSRLKNETMSDKDYEVVQQAWSEKDMKTVKDLLVWYNNLDVKPFLEAVERQSEIYKSKGIDMLKEGLSLPGLAVIWMFATVGEPESIMELYERQPTDTDKFERARDAVLGSTSVHLFDNANKDLYQLFKNNTVGGPSQVFHRYHERGVTKIRPDVYGKEAKDCQEVLGVDANALYLYCVQGKMPVGRPRRRFEKDHFAIDRRDKTSRSAQGWLAWIEMTTGQKLEAEYKGGERRLGRHNLPVDGFCQESQTVFQFHGCFWHGHSCSPSSSRDLLGKTAEERLYDTRAKEKYLTSLGYNVQSVWQCHWNKRVGMDKSIKGFLKAFYDKTYGVDETMSTQDVLDLIKRGKLFGFVECDIKVPDHLVQKFTEMPPIFKNTEISREHLSDHMRQFAEENDHLLRPQRSLIASMRGDKILLFSELLRWYLEHGLVVTRVYQVVEYEGRHIFESFGKSVSDARRAGDADSSLELLANTAKLVGNSLYGKTITDKTKHKNVNYFSDNHQASLAIRSNQFHSINQLDEGVYETVSFKKRVSNTLISRYCFDLPVDNVYSLFFFFFSST
jgi:G:T-mismatch repair DNA endonuclease (very short patch repair protein)